MTEPDHPPSLDTVEAVVRRQMAAALGGRRGIVETSIPGVLFTVFWLATKDLRLALIASGGAAAIALVVRLVQRSSVQYAVNALVGIGIGWIFVRFAAASGGSADDQALAYFLPGIVYTLIWTSGMVASCLAGWPFIGFMVGSVTGDPTAWHEDRQVVALCSRLTWLFLLPGAIGVLLQGPIWLLGYTETVDTAVAVSILAVLRLGLGWALRIASWAAMVWLLARDATPLEAQPG